MKQENLMANSFKFVAKDLVGSLLYWPIWWYTKGYLQAVKTALKQIKKEEQRIGLRVWMANLFKPMYGQYDWQGRLISFLMRFVVMIIRIFKLIIWTLLVIIMLAGWGILPLYALFQVLRHFVWW